jgi:hypothetical protein
MRLRTGDLQRLDWWPPETRLIPDWCGCNPRATEARRDSEPRDLSEGPVILPDGNPPQKCPGEASCACAGRGEARRHPHRGRHRRSGRAECLGAGRKRCGAERPDDRSLLVRADEVTQ